MNKMNKKGFTLAELLIVVAIIGVLTAIAIPVFNSQLEKSREATDLANVRSAYAELVTASLTEDAAPTSGSSDIVFSARTGSEGSYVYVATVTLKQKVSDWQTTGAATAVAGVTATGTPGAGGECVITYNEATETTTIVYSAA